MRQGLVKVRCPSVCLSHSPAAEACGGFAAVGPVGRRYRSIAAAAGHYSSTAHSSKCERCRVDSRATRLNTDCRELRWFARVVVTVRADETATRADGCAPAGRQSDRAVVGAGLSCQRICIALRAWILPSPSRLRYGLFYALKILKIHIQTRYRPGGGETISPPADGNSTVAKIAADLRPSADGSAVRTSLVAGGGYAAGSQRACSLSSCAMGQTDGRIALFQNAP